MLAQNFKTADELEVSEDERRALIKVLGMFERGEISPDQFNMRHWECGTTACIGGWVRRVGGEHLLRHLLPFGARGIDNLCYPDVMAIKINSVSTAALALRNFLTTGAPCWKQLQSTQ